MVHRILEIRHVAWLLVLFSLSTNCQSQNPEDLQQVFEKHIGFLASDELEGRETGTKGEELAAQYLAQTFKSVGLVPKENSEGYFQPFEFLLTREFSNQDFLFIDNKKVTISDGYFPLNFSGKGSAQAQLVDVGFGISAPELEYDDYKGKGEIKGKIFLIEVSSPDGVHPHSNYLAYHGLKIRVKTAEQKGAAAVIFVNSDQQVNDPIKDYSLKVASTDIPVVFVSNQDGLKDGQHIKLSVGLKELKRQGKNVIGYIDHRAASTMIIGAHYDHLGYGQNGGSLHRGEKSIHNGADDNASGTTMLIALAQAFQNESFKKYNYLFIAFSGEEKGLLGSNYFVKNPTIDLSKANLMINMDMVGRLDAEDPVLVINGTGTSPAWDSVLAQTTIEGLKIKTTTSGVGPSDHTSFYFQDIPVLHFFTGTHRDYHKPTDDAENLNYPGMVKVYQYLHQLVAKLSQMERLAFSKTKADTANTPRFTVTLGVVPDYAFSGEGMRIEGVTEDKPASKAGLETGDVVIKMGSYNVDDMMAYMQVLSQFKKGDQTTVVVQRGEEQLPFEVTF